MMWVNAKVWFCDPLTCAASSGVRIRAPMRLSTLWLGWFEFCIVFLLSIGQWKRLARGGREKQTLLIAVQKRLPALGRVWCAPVRLRTTLARELLWAALKRQPALFP